jgi:hypothetical protein
MSLADAALLEVLFAIKDYMGQEAMDDYPNIKVGLRILEPIILHPIQLPVCCRINCTGTPVI